MAWLRTCVDHGLLAAMLAAFAGMVLLELFDPATSGVFPPCPLHYLTGWYCPGCGSLRAIHQLVAWKPAGGVGDESTDRGAAAVSELRISFVCSFGIARARTSSAVPAGGVDSGSVRRDRSVWDCSEIFLLHPFDWLAPARCCIFKSRAKKETCLSSFCLGCGNSLAEGERFCGVCGRDSQAGAGVRAVDPSVAFGPPETSGKGDFQPDQRNPVDHPSAFVCRGYLWTFVALGNPQERAAGSREEDWRSRDWSWVIRESR